MMMHKVEKLSFLPPYEPALPVLEANIFRPA